MLEDDQIFPEIAIEDTWCYNKYTIALMQGLECFTEFDQRYQEERYVIRPMINLNGMGEGAVIVTRADLIRGTKIPAGFFATEFLEGDVITIDFKYGVPVAQYRGVRDGIGFSSWHTDQLTQVQLPEEIQELLNKYPQTNIEMIGDKVIEVHLNRHNPDFEDRDYKELIVVKDYSDLSTRVGYTWIPDKVANRLGFLAK